jgi:GH35 family endo-1,4-beta-xylanase
MKGRIQEDTTCSDVRLAEIELEYRCKVMKKQRRKWVLIENSSQQTFEFDSLKALRNFAKERGFKIRKSPTDDRTYYTRSYTFLPTGEDD